MLTLGLWSMSQPFGLPLGSLQTSSFKCPSLGSRPGLWIEQLCTHRDAHMWIQRPTGIKLLIRLVLPILLQLLIESSAHCMATHCPHRLSTNKVLCFRCKATIVRQTSDSCKRVAHISCDERGHTEASSSPSPVKLTTSNQIKFNNKSQTEKTCATLGYMFVYRASGHGLFPLGMGVACWFILCPL